MLEPVFSQGDVVIHQKWGVGYITEVNIGPDPYIIVDFPSKPGHKIKSDLAIEVLRKLPSDGLETLLLKEHDKVIQWGRTAPLKLIGSVLADFAEPAKPADIQAKLVGRDLLPASWKTWWKKVGPAMRNSPHHFRRISNSSYQLVTTIEQIAEEPLITSPKKARLTRMTSSDIEDTVAKLEAGQTDFQSLKGAKVLQVIAKELVRRSSTSQGARDAIRKTLDGHVLHIRIILEELSISGNLSYLIETLTTYVKSIDVLAALQSPKKGATVGQHVVAKVHLLDITVKRITERYQLSAYESTTPKLVHALTQLALATWRKNISGWRSKTLIYVMSSLARLTEKMPTVLDLVGEYLIGHDSEIPAKISVIDSFLAKVEPAQRADAINRLLLVLLAGPPELLEECFTHHVREEEQLRWISSALHRSCNTGAISVLARLLLKKSSRLDARELGMFLNSAIAVLSVYPEAEATFGFILADKLGQKLDIAPPQGLKPRQPGVSENIVELIHIVHAKKIEEQSQVFERARMALESDRKQAQEALETLRNKFAKLEEVAEELRSSYRLPEQWAEFRGKKEPLERLARLYQDIFLATEDDATRKATAWVLQRLENILQTYGVSKFGGINSRERYDPALHEFVPGFEGSENQVTVKCPGFQWKDPSDSRIVLVRAKVVK